MEMEMKGSGELRWQDRFLAEEGKSERSTQLPEASTGMWSLGERAYEVTQYLNPQTWRLPDPGIADTISSIGSSIGSLTYAALFSRDRYTPALPADETMETSIQGVFKKTFESKHYDMLSKLQAFKTPHDLCTARNLTCLITPVNEQLEALNAPLKEHEKQNLALGTYCENHALFDLAARQMVEFFAYASEDSASHANPASAYTNPGSDLEPIYTLCVPYIAKGGKAIGKIRITAEADSRFYASPRSMASSCNRAIKLFPYQLESIIDAAQKHIIKKNQEVASKEFSSDQVIEAAKNSPEYHGLEMHRAEFQKTQEQTFTYFNLAYKVHRDFVIKNALLGDTLQLAFLDLSPQRAAQVTEAVLAFLKDLHENPSVFGIRGFLGKKPGARLKDFEKEIPSILKITIENIRQALQLSFAKHFPTEPPRDYPHFLMARNLDLPLALVTRALKPHMKILEPQANGNSSKDYASFVLDCILSALVGHEIAAYYPHFNLSNSNSSTHRILC